MFRLLRNSERKFSVLLVAESHGGKIHPGSWNALTAAQKLKKPIDVLVLDAGVKEVPMKGEGVQEIFLSNHAAFTHATADVYTHAINTFIKTQKKYTHIVVPTSNWSKDYFPRLAGINHAMPVTDVVDIVDESTYRRPTYAGNAINTVKSPGPLHFIAARVTNFDAAAHSNGQTTAVDGE